ncbi:beta-glucosidase 11-like isoform X3 [Ziziphus jujuba]|uniref:Beta-glucosidase 11-like isoform X3 n=1 Tax=Ziziphus jujuba TaxID=326968 RepID=A0ABM3IWT0_ZIZJJ|nr:beta-glucosidase 11-like isoform X4 [Ziziphus jujuba var. spinosa]XP_048336886.1 beta-glucosidase 11-like isoform X3 [Ziziphus jujuba]XP_048336887.1 beta-glucosidase 11-like isoform X3 [Ziziphus jujuba]
MGGLPAFGIVLLLLVEELHQYLRISITNIRKMYNSWRIRASMPIDFLSHDGRGPVNPKGLQYYNNLINELISHGIQPHVTLHHNDLPLALEDEYGGWVNHRIVKDFMAYADVCFREFGDRVLYWSTVNEANMFSTGGYDMGAMAPFRCSPPFGIKNCSRGNSSTEPYMVAHNILLAHASTAKLYRLKYQNKQHGLIGFIIFTYAIERVTESKEEDFVIQRVNDFNFGWLLHPLVFGDYPVIMKRNAGSRIPTFTNYQSELVKGSFDFIGILHYSYSNVKDNPDSLTMQLRDFYADMAATVNYHMTKEPLPLLPIAPWGLRRVLEYIKEVYGNPPIYIYENGQGLTLNSDSALDDIPRIDYLREHIGALLEALRNGSNTRGYFVWSFIDLLELFRKPNKFSFGLYHVDLDDPDLKRYPKKSALWYSNFLKGGNITALDVVPKLSSV